tara:strand:+ start:708 stop:923 length:216 start_codon:yes stop_codon:yes gene_type:complete
MKVRALFLAMALTVFATLVTADETFGAVIDQDTNDDAPPAVWIVNQSTGQVKFCVVANNNTAVICSEWSDK